MLHTAGAAKVSQFEDLIEEAAAELEVVETQLQQANEQRVQEEGRLADTQAALQKGELARKQVSRVGSLLWDSWLCHMSN